MITSTQNAQVKYWKKLQTKKGRVQSGSFWVEGFHLVEDALASDWLVQEIIIGELTPIPDDCQTIPNTTVSDDVFSYLTLTQQPQPIAAVVTMNQDQEVSGTHLLLIDAVQDPGNLGTMIRTADAAGFDGVIVGSDSVDLYNDKVIRATQGSLFHISILQKNLDTVMDDLQRNGFAVWAAALENGHPYTAVRPAAKVGLLVGNEGAGISQNLIEKADTIVTVPIHGRAESLNVSIAAAILMYHMKG